MNTKVISNNNVVMGTIISARVAGLFAFAPMYAEARSPKIPKTTVNLTCMQTAVDTREDAVSNAFKGFNDDVVSALAARKTGLHDAWGLSDKVARASAVKASWTAWKTAKKAAHSELKTARKSAWNTFKTTAKTSCKEVVQKLFIFYHLTSQQF